MITIHTVEETLQFYASLGAAQKDTGNGSLFTFKDQLSHVRFWGDLKGFCVASVDITFPCDMITRSQFHERYIGISFTKEGSVATYSRKSEIRNSHTGIDCYVFHSPVPLFMKIPGGCRLRFRGMYFQEAFFRENKIHLYDSFWEDARRSLACHDIHAPELFSIFQHIEKCPLTGDAFQIWMRGQGLAAAGHLLNLVQRCSLVPPVSLEREDIAAVMKAKEIIGHDLENVPMIPELCKRVSLNKNKLQKAFRLTEGKSIGEYVRTLRMEFAFELLEKSTMTISEIAGKTGCHSTSNFYRIFQQTFGETPQNIREMIRKEKSL